MAAIVATPILGRCAILENWGFRVVHAEQLNLSVSVVAPWLDAFLRDDPSGLYGLEQAAESGGLDLTLSCALSVETPQSNVLEVFYQDPPSGLTLRNTTNLPMRVTLWSVYGRPVLQQTMEPAMQWVPRVPNGAYVVTMDGAAARTVVVQ